MARKFDTYCGIYCGACSILVHGETRRADGFVACCKGVPESEIACGGCKSDSVYPGCRTCKMRDCAVQRGVAHCCDCKDYPCKMYKQWQSARRVLPHIGESPGSLEAVRRDGVDAWLYAQQKRWSCPQCGTRFSWYSTECSQCGRSLAVEAYTMKGIRKLVCRWIIPATYRRGKRG
jgi:hypothetical protein